MRSRLAITLLSAAALLPATTTAQERAQSAAGVTLEPAEAYSGRAPYRLVFDHVTGRFSLENQRGEPVSWESRGWGQGQGALAPVPADRPLEVVIINANSLLYEYQVEAAPVGDQRVRICRDLGRDFVRTGFVVATRGIVAGTPDLFPTFDDFTAGADELEQAAALPEKGLDLGGGLLAERESALAAGRSGLQRYRQLTATVGHLAATIQDSIRLVALRAEATPITPLLAGLEASIERAHPGLSDPRVVPTILIQQAQSVSAALQLAADGHGDALAVEAMALREELEHAARSAQEDVHRLQEQLVTLARARAGATRSFTVLPSATAQRVVVHLAPADSSTFFRSRIGDAVTYTRPSVSLICEVSIGITWMEPPAEFVRGSDGLLEDSSLDADARTAAALMLHFTLPSVPHLGVLGGIGLGRGQTPDLYLGGSLRMLNPVLINLGTVWQRERRLPGGVRLGDPVESDVIRSLNRRFVPSWFVGVSVGR